MAARDDISDDDLLTLLLGALLVGFAINAMRFARADASGLQFAGAYPGGTGGVIGPGSAIGGLIAMNVSPQGRAFIQQQEGGFHATPYPDAGGYSIGYGHHYPRGVQPPASITQEQADAFFEADIGTVESTINESVLVPLNQNQFDALADFVFNVGAANFKSSTLLRRLNAGNYRNAAQQFQRWDISQGRANARLDQRRQAESRLFQQAGA